jgi:deoxycytidine triphosphate deaminase
VFSFLTLEGAILGDADVRAKRIKPEEAKEIVEKLEELLRAEDREGIKKLFESTIGDRLLIYPFDENSLQSSSYDLRVGDSASSLTFGRRTDDTTKLELQPRECANVQTLEYVALPANLTAFIHSKVSKVLSGLSHVSTKVDPGFFGHLMIAVYNDGSKPVSLRKKDTFCAITFAKLVSPSSDPYYLKGEHCGKGAWESYVAELREIRRAEKGQVTWDSMKGVFDSYGPPFDVVYEMFHVLKNEFEDRLSNTLRDFRQDLIEKTGNMIDKRENNLMRNVMIPIVVSIVLAFLALIFEVVYRK